MKHNKKIQNKNSSCKSTRNNTRTCSITTNSTISKTTTNTRRATKSHELRANENSQYSDDWTEEDQAQAESRTDGYGMADDTGDSVDEMMKRSEEFNKEMGLE